MKKEQILQAIGKFDTRTVSVAGVTVCLRPLSFGAAATVQSTECNVERMRIIIADALIDDNGDRVFDGPGDRRLADIPMDTINAIASVAAEAIDETPKEAVGN